MESQNEWITTKVRKSIHDKINDFIKNGVDPTITNFSQFTDLALREKIEKLEATKK